MANFTRRGINDSRITRENVQQSLFFSRRDNCPFMKWRMIKFFGWKKMISNRYRFNRNWTGMDVKWGCKVRCKRISASTFALSTSRGEIRKTLIRRNTRHDTITLYLPPRVLFRMETFSPSFRAHRVLHTYLFTFRRATLTPSVLLFLSNSSVRHSPETRKLLSILSLSVSSSPSSPLRNSSVSTTNDVSNF